MLEYLDILHPYGWKDEVCCHVNKRYRDKLETYLHASHKSIMHIDAIFIDLRIKDIFLKYTSDDLFGKEINKSTICAF